MNIIVLVKQVPNTTEMKIDKEKGTLIRDGVDTIVNPDDMASIELALRIKDEHPNTHVRVMTMGPAQAKNMLTDLYGYGIDDCVLLCAREFAGSDTWATSFTLAEAIKDYPYDLILAGRQAIDGDTAQVGPQVAQHLHIPQITYVSKVNEISAEKIQVTKHYEDYDEILEAKFPLLLTTLADEVDVRLANFTDTWNAENKEITVLDQQQLQLDPANIGLKGSLTQVKKTFVRPVSKKGEMIEEDVDLAAKRIAEMLTSASQ